jgi:hypothetical protein
MQNTENLLKSWNAEFQSKCDRVRNLIGSRHWLSDGRHKEEIVADHLRKYLGPAWMIGSGFIVGDSSSSISPELDILIDDPVVSPPLLSDGSVRIVHSEGVAAYFEIKSTLSGEVLSDVLTHQFNVLTTLKSAANPVWCGAVFFQIDGVQKSFLKTLKDHLDSARSAGLLENERSFCYVVIGHHVTFVDISNSHPLRIKQFPATDLSISLALIDLFDFLSRRPAAHSRGFLQEHLLREIEIGPPTILDLEQK